MSTGVFNSNSNSAGTPAVSATGTNGAKGVNATSDSGIAVFAEATGTGLAGAFGSWPITPVRIPRPRLTQES